MAWYHNYIPIEMFMPGLVAMAGYVRFGEDRARQQTSMPMDLKTMELHYLDQN